MIKWCSRRPTGCLRRRIRRSSLRSSPAGRAPRATSETCRLAICGLAGAPPRSDRGRPLIHSRRSCRFLRAAAGGALSGQIAIEQDFRSENVRAHRKAQSLIHLFDWRERQAGRAGKRLRSAQRPHAAGRGIPPTKIATRYWRRLRSGCDETQDRKARRESAAVEWIHSPASPARFRYPVADRFVWHHPLR